MARVLIVDDEAGMRLSLGTFVRGLGHEAHAAENFKIARELLSRQPFDVVLSDIIMPGENGIQLLEFIRRQSPDTQVVLITGEPTIETATDALRLGAFDYLAKPVLKEDVVAVVSRAVKHKALLDENRRLQAENTKHSEHLEHQVQGRTAELAESLLRLRRALDGAVQAMALVVERRDPYTAGHQRRVAAVAAEIARLMKLPDAAVEGVLMASAIHDIGKIAVPSEILSKPGKLSVNEMNLIKTHSTIGYEILAPIEFPWPIADIVLQHHERMDGSGYPHQRKGDEILVEARIVAVADVVEAISSHRPYRAALGLEAGLQEITANKGKFYDPAVADACVHLFRETEFRL